VAGDLAAHYQTVRTELERHRGTEVATTGDGLLAIFDSPGLAIRCAAAIRAEATRSGLDIRAGVHVGEVEVSGANVHGVAVHEAARIMAEARPGEILVSEVTRTLASMSGLQFDDRGTRELKGLPGERRLFAYTPA
jgi:class 3 adenylate cyclase